jgi:hypothetical protein
MFAVLVGLRVVFQNIALPAANPLSWWFLFAFLGGWLFVCAIFSVTSGWSTLAQRFRASTRPVGQKLTRQVDKFGFWTEHGVTNMVLAESGLYLYHHVLFRFLHPPLFLPWSEIGCVREVKVLWWRRYEIDLAGVTTIRVQREAHDAISKYLTFERVGSESGVFSNEEPGLKEH